MKILNFTATEILPSLLDKSKTQTIRPAWSKKSVITIKHKTTPKEFKKFKKILENINKNNIIVSPDYDVETLFKPPRFNVDQEIKLMWNQRSQYKWFCRTCGKKVAKERDTNKRCHNCYCEPHPSTWDKYYFNFNKTLGTAEITEVFEIEMYKSNCASWIKPCKGYYVPDLNIWEKDGFSSEEEMFAWFDKAYDLRSPKKFHVYRWKWLK